MFESRILEIFVLLKTHSSHLNGKKKSSNFKAKIAEDLQWQHACGLKLFSKLHLLN